jgi:hypothetical protein
MHWTASLSPSKGQVCLLITDSECGDVLKARLPVDVRHPRALLTLLEGVALWQGSALRTAIVADGGYPSFAGSGLFGDELWPGESQLVLFEVVARARPKRLSGLGDFRRLRRGGLR